LNKAALFLFITVYEILQKEAVGCMIDEDGAVEHKELNVVLFAQCVQMEIMLLL
jgi:hypothetical protein